MKKYIIITLTLILMVPAVELTAQEMQYLFGGGEKGVSVSGFAGVLNEFSTFDKDFAFSMGGGAALLIDQKFFFGAYGLGLTTRHIEDYTWYDDYLKKNIDKYDLYTRFGHGGFWLGYIHKAEKAIHWGANLKLGWGSYSITDKRYPDETYKWENYEIDNVFVVTPQVDLDMNLLKWMRLNVGVGYRWVSGVNKTYKFDDPQKGIVEKPYYDKNALNSVTGTVTLAFGWFNK